jgi:quercetin dioxygenase-like cupin family protein
VKALPAGSFIIIPAGTPHFLSIDTETIVQVQGIGRIGMTYVKASGPRP